MKKIISLLMVLVFVFTFAACGKDNGASGESNTNEAKKPAPSGKKLSISLEKEKGENNVTYDMYITDEGIYKVTDDGVEVLDDFGNNKLGKTYLAAEALLPGIFEVRDSEEINSTGLVATDGTVLIPCEAAFIRAINDRYCKVYYATEEVSNEDDCLFYVTESMLSLEVKDDDVMYDGYIKVFDMQKKSFVKDLKLENPSDDITIVGDNLFVSDGSFKMYSTDKGVIEEFGLFPNYGKNYLTVEDDNKYIVYDCNMKEVEKLDGDFEFEEVITKGVFIKYVDDGKYIVVDSKGNTIFDNDTDKRVFYNDKYMWVDDSGKGCILDFEGNKLIENISSIEYCSNDVMGEYFTMEKDFKDIIWFPSSNQETVTNDFINSDRTAFIDILTGKELLTGYSYIEMGHGYVYAFTDADECEIYKLVIE